MQCVGAGQYCQWVTGLVGLTSLNIMPFYGTWGISYRDNNDGFKGTHHYIDL
jgi:hypothetical protein